MQSSFPLLFHGLISSPVGQKDYSISFTPIKREKWLLQISESDNEGFIPGDNSYRVVEKFCEDNEDIKEIKRVLSQTNVRLSTRRVWSYTRAIPGDNGSAFLMYHLFDRGDYYNQSYYFIIRREKSGARKILQVRINSFCSLVYREKEDELFLFYNEKYSVFDGKSLILKREGKYPYNIRYVFTDGCENFVIVHRSRGFEGTTFTLLNEKMEPLIERVPICDGHTDVKAITRHPSGYYLAVLSGNESQLLLYREDFTLADQIELPRGRFRGFKIDKLITEACTGRVIAQMRKDGDYEHELFWLEIKIEPFLPEQEEGIFGVAPDKAERVTLSPDREAERVTLSPDREAERATLSPEDLWLADAWKPPPAKESPTFSLKQTSLIFLTLGAVLYFFLTV